LFICEKNQSQKASASTTWRVRITQSALYAFNGYVSSDANDANDDDDDDDDDDATMLANNDLRFERSRIGSRWNSLQPDIRVKINRPIVIAFM